MGSRQHFDLVQGELEISYDSEQRGCLDRRFFHFADASPQDWGEMACYREFDPAALSNDSAQNRCDEHAANSTIPQAGVSKPPNTPRRPFGVNHENDGRFWPPLHPAPGRHL